MTTVPEEQRTDRVEADLLAFLATRTKTTPDPDLDIFAAGGVSSMFALQLVMHIESTFDVQIDGDDLTIDNFRTVRAMAALVHRLRSAATGG